MADTLTVNDVWDPTIHGADDVGRAERASENEEGGWYSISGRYVGMVAARSHAGVTDLAHPFFDV
jgi:hypothetical protein